MTLDEIIKKQKEHLTNAQIKALAQAAARYKQVSAAKRAEAYSSLHKGLSTTRRGLQNVGLASRAGKIISGQQKAAGIRAQEAYSDYSAGLDKVATAYTQQAAARMSHETMIQEHLANLQEQQQKINAEAEKVRKEYQTYLARKRAAEEAARKAAEEAAKQQQQQQAAREAKAMRKVAEKGGTPKLWNQEVSDSGSGFQTREEEQAFIRQYDPTKHTNAENLDHYKRVAKINGMSDSEAQKYAWVVTADVANRRGAAKQAIQPYQKVTNEERLAIAGRVMNDPLNRFKRDYGVDTRKITNPETASAVKSAVTSAYKEIDEKTAAWEKKIAAGESALKDGKTYYGKSEVVQEMNRARSEMANAYATLARMSVAAENPGVADLILMDDDQFAVAYDAAQQATKEKNYSAGYNSGAYQYETQAREGRLAAAEKTLARFLQAEYARNLTSKKAYRWNLVENEPPEINTVGKSMISDVMSVRDPREYDKANGTEDSLYSAIINEYAPTLVNPAYWYTARGKADEWGSIDSPERNRFIRTANDLVEYKPGITKDEAPIAKLDKMKAVLAASHYMTDDERDRFNTILYKYGAKDADAYFEYLYNNVLPARINQAVDVDYDAMFRRETEYDDYGNRTGAKDSENTWVTQLTSSLLSVPLNLAEGLVNPIRTIARHQQDPVAARLNARKYGSAQEVRNAVQENFSKTGRFLYGTGMSMLDSAAVGAISGGLGSAFTKLGMPSKWATRAGSVLGGSLLGGSAFNSSYSEALQRGLSPDKARATALGNGINEMLFESLSLDLLVSRFKTGDIVNVSEKAWKNWLVNTLIQGGVEGSEEVFTDLANRAWDNVVNGIYSEEMQKLREYMANGMSYEEAMRKVKDEFNEQLGMSFLGGAISGGVMGGAAGARYNFAMRDYERTGKTLDTDMRKTIDQFQFKDKQMQELQQQSKKTNQDYGVLYNAMKGQLYDQYKGNIQQAVEDGTITKDAADLLEKYQQKGVQTVEDGKVVANEQGITEEEYKTVKDALAKLDISPLTQIANADERLQFNRAVGVKNADTLNAYEAKQNEAQKQYDEEVAKIEADETLTDAQKEQMKAEAYQRMTDAQGKAREELSAKVGKKVDIKVEKDGTTVKTKKGSGTVTFDFSTYNNGKSENHNSVETMTEREKAALRIAQVVAALNGTNIKVEAQFTSRTLKDGTVENLSDKNGYYDADTDTIHVNLNGTNSVLWTISHELTHRLATMNKQGYTELHDAIKTELTKENLTYSEVQTLDHSYQIDKLQTYLNKGMNLWDALVAYEESRGYKRADAEEEVIARCCEQFLAKTTFINSFASKHYKTARSISAFLMRMNADMQQLFADVNTRSTKAATTRNEQGYFETWNTDVSPEQDILNQMDALYDIARKWENAVKKVEQKRKEVKEAKKSQVQYSKQDVENVTPATREESKTLDMLDKRNLARYYNEVDSVLNNTMSSGEVVLIGKPSALLAKYLGNENVLLTVQKAIRKAVYGSDKNGKHGLGKGVVYGLPYQLYDPVAITGNTTKHEAANDKSIVVWTSWVTNAGDPIIVPIRIDAKGRVELYNNVNTVFDAWDEDYRNDLLREGNVLYTKDNKNILDLLAQGREVPEDFGRDVSKDSISKETESVKLSGLKPQKKFSTQDIETSAAMTDKEYEAKRDQFRKESASIKDELQDVRAKLQEVEQSASYKSAFERMMDKSLSDDEWKAAIDAFAKVEEESGHDALYKRQKELIEKQSAISKEWDKVIRGKELSDYRKAVTESGLTEAEFSRKQAVKEFGYTPYYYDAGYILPNGKMLNFSGEKGKHYGTRGQDHRAVGTIYPDSQGSDAMIRFMNDGNIRIMAETPGVDLSSKVEPTREQYATIRAFAESSRREGYFNVDLSDERGNNVGTLEYDGNVNPTRIINDIKHFYATGEVREQSSVSQFHFSTQDKDFHLTQRIGEQRVYEMRGTTANVYGTSVELEGGTLLNRVRMMQNLAEMYGSVTVTATSEKEAQAFEKAGAQREADTFGDTEYGTWAFEHQDDQYRKDSQYDAKQKRKFADAVLKEVGTRKNFTKEDLRIIRAKLEKAFAVLHNATFGKGDQLVAFEYADKLFDQILNRYTEMSETDAEMRDAILAEMPRRTDAKGRVYREIEVTKGQMAEIRSAFESISEYNRALSKALGARVVVKEAANAQTLEDVFASNPYLDGRTNEGDMPAVLLERSQETVGKRTNPYKSESQERAALKDAMFDKALSIVGIEKSTAQKVREAVREARAEERAKAKDKTAKAVSEARLAERMHEGAIRAKESREAAQREATIKRTAREREAKLKEVTQQKLIKQKVEQLRRDTKTIALRWNQRLVKMLANPTEASHIPVQLAREVAEFTDTLTKYLDSDTERGKLNLEKIAKAYKQAFDDQATIAQAQAENPNYDPRGQVIDSEMYDQQLEDMINELNDILQTKSLKDLNPFELRMLLNTVRGVAHKVYDANRLIGTSERKAIWQVGDKMVNELESAPKVSLRWYLEQSLDMRRLARIFSGSNDNAEFVKLANQMNDGAIEKERIAQALQGIFKPVTDRYGDEIRTWYGKKAEWIDTGIIKRGKPVEITKGMRVSLAMHVQNAGNMNHIENGGLTIPNREMYRKGKLQDAYANGELVRLNADQIRDIISQMTEAERAYVRAAQELFHKRTGYYVNRTSLALVGYRKAIVENYFPIHTDKNFTKTDFADLKKDGSIEGQGFLKERVYASNPVYLEDITSVVNRQIRGVALYAGLAIPMRNFNAIMNASIYDEDDNGAWSPRTTVKQTLTQKMGAYGAKVVEGFLTDVSEMSHVDVTPMERFAGMLSTNYVKAVLLGNLKVALKQVASYPTAAAVIPWKYLGKALLKGGRNHRLISRADVDLINQYTPLYQMRKEGNANEIASIMQKRGMEQKLPWLLGWITKMDVMTVGRLWSAAEYMVADQQKDLPVGSDEYYKAVAKVFNDTIQQTQPNFTPLQRNAALRSKNPIVRSLVLFGTQRMQNGGILMEAAYELAHSKGKSKEEIQAARQKLGRAVASQIVQNILLVVASLVVDALRGRMKSWQDKDKEITIESLAKGMGDAFLSNAVGSFLGGSELYELLSAWYKDDAYDTEFTVPALEALEFIFNYVGNELPDTIKYLKSSEHTLEEKLKKAKASGAKLVKAAGYATGIPLENAYKDLMKGIIPAIQDHADWLKTGEFPQWWLHQSGKLDNAKTAANYKEWTNAGKKGSEYFYWQNVANSIPKSDETGYPKSEILAEKLLASKKLTTDEKAMLYRMLAGSDLISAGAKVYRQPTISQKVHSPETLEHGDVVVDFTNADRYATSMMGAAKYSAFEKAVEMGVPEDVAATAFRQFAAAKKYETRSGVKAGDRFHDWLFEMVDDPEQRAMLDMQVVGKVKRVDGAIGYKANGEVYADYSSKELFDTYLNGTKTVKADAVSNTDESPQKKAETFASMYPGYTAKDGIVYNDKGVVQADYTSDEAYTASQMGESHYKLYTNAVKIGMRKENAIKAVEMHKEIMNDDDKDNSTQATSWIFKTYKNANDRAIAGSMFTTKPVTVKNGRTYDEDGYIYRDYTSVAWYKLSNRKLSKDGKNKRYETAQTLTKQGYTAEQIVATYVELDKLSKKSEWKKYLKDHGFTDEQINLFLWSRGWAK